MKIGDVIEVCADRKLTYLHLTCNHFSKGDGFWYGWFCRVLSGSFSKRPSAQRLRKAVTDPEQFGCFYANAKDCEVVANFTDGPGAGSFPICKQVIGSQSSPTCAWVFWNGVEERVAFRIPNEAANFPNREIVDTDVILKRIAQGWTPCLDVPSQCIDSRADRFAFAEFPLLSDFEKDRSRFGDIIGFLASRGLIPKTSMDVSIELAGIGPFENSAADRWLSSWGGNDGWNAVSLAINTFRESLDRNASVSAIAVAASGLILASSGLMNCPYRKVSDILSSCGPAPIDLIRSAMVAMMDVQLRSGLKEVWAENAKGPAWLELTSKQQMQLMELRRTRMK